MFSAWKEFRKGKRSKEDVYLFELNLEQNLFDLNEKLQYENWQADPYKSFFIRDPKLRQIHKASVRDRVFYQAVYRILYQIFDPKFIFHSYSSRNLKGIHAGTKSLDKYIRKVTRNYTKSGCIVKCDIKKFFDSIDHNILLDIISKQVVDKKFVCLIEEIIHSFEKTKGRGLPLGNVTSQIFSNIYLNEMDQFIKHSLRAKYYIRYCDDFVLVSDSVKFLEGCVEEIKIFCTKKLSLQLHPNKIVFRKIHQGIDFLGYVKLPNRSILRTKTKNRLLKKLTHLKEAFNNGTVEAKHMEDVTQSYLGLLAHCKGKNIESQIERIFWD